MATDISPTTGEAYYSGTWGEIREVLRVLNIGQGKLAQVTQPMVNHYQERVDRDIDAKLESLYHVPVRSINQVQPDGSIKAVFPGDIRYIALYWAAGLLLLNEFQNLEQNQTDQAQGYVERSQRQLFTVVSPDHRIWGLERKSNISHTLPPNLQPNRYPEAQF